MDPTISRSEYLYSTASEWYSSATPMNSGLGLHGFPWDAINSYINLNPAVPPPKGHDMAYPSSSLSSSPLPSRGWRPHPHVPGPHHLLPQPGIPWAIWAPGPGFPGSAGPLPEHGPAHGPAGYYPSPGSISRAAPMGAQAVPPLPPPPSRPNFLHLPDPMAIRGGKQMLTRNEITSGSWTLFPSYRENQQRWQNSIRHSPPSHDCFFQVAPRPTSPARDLLGACNTNRHMFEERLLPAAAERYQDRERRRRQEGGKSQEGGAAAAAAREGGADSMSGVTAPPGARRGADSTHSTPLPPGLLHRTTSSTAGDSLMDCAPTAISPPSLSLKQQDKHKKEQEPCFTKLSYTVYNNIGSRGHLMDG
ncbi:unnamed protein product [Arctogadus glacialis]